MGAVGFVCLLSALLTVTENDWKDIEVDKTKRISSLDKTTHISSRHKITKGAVLLQCVIIDEAMQCQSNCWLIILSMPSRKHFPL